MFKIALVTGGASGIGLETTKLLIDKCCHVHVLDLNPIIFKHPNCKSHICDVSNLVEVKRTIEVIVKEHGRIDYLFAGAGIHLRGTIEEVAYHDILHLFNVNIMGTINVVKETIGYMKQGGGSIVLMGSDQSKIAKPHNSLYGLTKGALSIFAKGLAVDYAESRIRVNCICPGTIQTNMYEKAIRKSSVLSGVSIEKIISTDESAQPIKRLGKAEEVAKAVWFLLSDDSSYITGADLFIDGGLTSTRGKV